MKVRYHPKVGAEDIPRLGSDNASRIEKAIHDRLYSEPEKYGFPLRRGLAGYRKLRVGDYRIIYTIKADEVRVIIIGHRSDVYYRVSKRLG